MTFFEQQLDVPVEQWTARQTIVFDGYDGPREGLCALENPRVEFRFVLIREQQNADGLDERYFRLYEVPAASIDKILGLLRTHLGTPSHPVWVPIWRFPSEASRANAEAAVMEIESMSRPTDVVVSSPDMMMFDGKWSIDRAGEWPRRADGSFLLGALPGH